MRRRGAEETERERLTVTRSLFDSLTVEQKLSHDLRAPTEEGEEQPSKVAMPVSVEGELDVSIKEEDA